MAETKTSGYLGSGTKARADIAKTIIWAYAGSYKPNLFNLQDGRFSVIVAEDDDRYVLGYLYTANTVVDLTSHKNLGLFIKEAFKKLGCPNVDLNSIEESSAVQHELLKLLHAPSGSSLTLKLTGSEKPQITVHSEEDQTFFL